MRVKGKRGGLVPPESHKQTEERIRIHAERILPQNANQIRVLFHANNCYIDADEGHPPLMHLCRLGWEGDSNRWSLAFYTYSVLHVFQ